MKISTLKKFEEFLKIRIPTREALFMGTIGLDRAKYFMKLLGNPQDKIKVVHIAGTSGKGSTAHLTSHALVSQGFSVGMSISPHIFDIRERMQINNQLPSEKLILKYFNQISPLIKKMEACKYGAPTFFEINVGLAYYIFAKEKLDYAVIETGLGGTLDATNTVTTKNKLCIITKLGLDHTEILGKTISKIAEQKAGIIGNKNTVIGYQSSVAGLNIIKKCCKEKNATLTIIGQKNYKIIFSTPLETVFDFNFSKYPCVISDLIRNPGYVANKKNPDFRFHGDDNAINFSLKNIHLGLIGAHQAENCSLALTCLALLSKRDKFKIDEHLLRSMLRNIAIPGRFEIKKIQQNTVIIDGAHNPQKMHAFTNNIAKIYPKQKFTFIIAFKKSKDFQEMLREIIPLANKIFFTHFSLSNQDNLHSSINNQEIILFLESRNFKKFKIIGNNKTEISKVIHDSKKTVVITGSLYLIGSIYKYLKQ